MRLDVPSALRRYVLQVQREYLCIIITVFVSSFFDVYLWLSPTLCSYWSDYHYVLVMNHG